MNTCRNVENMVNNFIRFSEMSTIHKRICQLIYKMPTELSLHGSELYFSNNLHLTLNKSVTEMHLHFLNSIFDSNEESLSWKSENKLNSKKLEYIAKSIQISYILNPSLHGFDAIGCKIGNGANNHKNL